MYSDRGTQLISAAGGLDPTDIEDELDWGKLGRQTGVNRSFCSDIPPLGQGGGPVPVEEWQSRSYSQVHKTEP